MGLIGLLVAFFAFAFLAEYFPGIFKLIVIMFCTCLVVLIVNPAAGAGLTLICLAVLAVILFLAALPFILSYLAGLAFIILLCIGLGELVK